MRLPFLTNSVDISPQKLIIVRRDVPRETTVQDEHSGASRSNAFGAIARTIAMQSLGTGGCRWSWLLSQIDIYDTQPRSPQKKLWWVRWISVYPLYIYICNQKTPFQQGFECPWHDDHGSNRSMRFFSQLLWKIGTLPPYHWKAPHTGIASSAAHWTSKEPLRPVATRKVYMWNIEAGIQFVSQGPCACHQNLSQGILKIRSFWSNTVNWIQSNSIRSGAFGAWSCIRFATMESWRGTGMTTF